MLKILALKILKQFIMVLCLINIEMFDYMYMIAIIVNPGKSSLMCVIPFCACYSDIIGDRYLASLLHMLHEYQSRKLNWNPIGHYSKPLFYAAYKTELTTMLSQTMCIRSSRPRFEYSRENCIS
jgi:hypothetical protein